MPLNITAAYSGLQSEAVFIFIFIFPKEQKLGYM
uniref:Uncharacterized protein n=1 Tax=Anguilla anguilla TaxID=7936 RepID=A0A0E9Q918_ANGAN